MAVYEITFRNVENPRESRVRHVEATNRESALALSSLKGWVVVDAVLSRASSDRKKRSTRRIPEQEVEKFCTIVGNMLAVNIPIQKALEFYLPRATHRGVKSAVKQAIENIKSGHDVDRAFAETKRFDFVFLGLLKAGSDASQLADALLAIARFIRVKIDAQSQLITKLSVPLIAIVLLIGIFVGVQVAFMPQIESFIGKSSVEPDPLSGFMIQVSHVVQDTWVLSVIAAVTVFLVMWASPTLRNQVLEVFLSRWRLLRYMIMSYRQLIFLATMDMLLDKNIPMRSILKTCTLVMQNTPLAKQLNAVCADYQERSDELGVVLERHTKLDTEVYHLIQLGELSGELPAQVRFLVELYQRYTTEYIKRFTGVIYMVTLLFAVILLAAVYLGAELPIVLMAPRIMKAAGG